jgi:tetratricopeptide (TPR) repeat protein
MEPDPDPTTEILDRAVRLRQSSGQQPLIQAIKLIQQALLAAPGSWEAQYELGRSFLLWSDHYTGWIRLAEKFFHRAVRLDPARAEAFFSLGHTMKSLGRADAAAPWYEQACVLAPDWVDAHLKAAEALGAAGEEARAGAHLEICRKLAPDDPAVVEALAATHTAPAVAAAPLVFARFPPSLSQLGDMRSAFERHVLAGMAFPRALTRASRVVTLGSCFAANIARALRDKGFHAYNNEIGETINSTTANRAYIDWVLQRPGNPDSDEVARTIRGDPKQNRRAIEEADLFVYTVGVAPCFFDRVTGRLRLPSDESFNFRRLAQECTFRTTTVEENAEHLAAIADTLSAVRPDAPIVLTLSPVPLAASFEYPSAFVADTVSKSTLRVAIDQVMRSGRRNLHYWPAFEAVRWLGAYLPGFYGAQDGSTRHVSQQVVAMITDAFIDRFREEEATAETAISGSA